MMDPTLKEQLTAFRYSLIAPIVSRQTPMQPGELKAYLERTAQQHYNIPGSHRTQISVRSLERYLSQYRKGEWEALKPKGRSSQGSTKLAADILQTAMTLRKERPERSVEQIIFLLEQRELVAEGAVAASTLARHLRKAGLSRKELLRGQIQGKERFEAELIHALWQSDFQHTMFIPDPKHPGKRKKVILCVILDDRSRYCVFCQFYWDEKLPRLEDALKKAILRFGIPEQFYCDNGAAFSSHHLARICGKLRIRLTHSRPYKPHGRGKVERLFRFIDTSFVPEAYREVESGRVKTLEELNALLVAWMDGYYHQRVHGTTKETPRDRLLQEERSMRRKSLTELQEIFLWEELRKVDAACCISLDGNQYEVDRELTGQQVLLRYDPFDLATIQVWKDDKRYKDAKVLALSRRRKRQVESVMDVVIEEEEDGQLSFFEAAEQRRQQAWADDPVQFSASQESETR
jgi:putative transposase